MDKNGASLPVLMKSITTSGETADINLQPLLGTDKSNPLFRALRDQEGERILLYYGLELLEVFPDYPDHFALRLCAGRLYNAGIKKCAIAKAFDMDIRTIARIARAMCASEPDELFRILQGRQRPRKLTPDISALIREMCETAFALHPRSPSRYLRDLVERVHGVSLSGETIRPLLAEYRNIIQTSPDNNTPTSCDPVEEPFSNSSGERGAQHHEDQSITKESDASLPLRSPSADRKRSACFPVRPRYLPHAGLLLFLPMLNELAKVDEQDGALLRQLASGVLLGAVNLEQTKLLDASALSFLLGALRWKSPSALRKELRRLAGRPGLRADLLSFNARLTGNRAPTYVFFDPHTKQYTGQYPVLYGWVASMKRVDKAIHGDWFHGPDGFPLWHRLEDNYEDLRQRFLPACRELRRDLELPEGHPLCVIVDRGIYGLESLEAIRQEPHLSVLTWDPASAEGESPLKESEVTSFTLIRKRNHSGDLLFTEIEAWETSSCRIPGARRVVFRTSSSVPGEWKTAAMLEVGGGELSPREMVMRMTKRWVQENDFKYQNEHFGLNELTCYAVVPYAELAGDLQDREVPNALRRALVEQTGELKRELGKLLITVRNGKKGLLREMGHLEELNLSLQKAESTREHSHMFHQATQCVKSFEKTHARISSKQKQADDIDKKLETLRKQIVKLPEKVSRLQNLIEKGNVRHDLKVKMFFDSVKMIARNMFCLRLREFRKHYDNLRDDHVILRALAQGSGTWVGEQEAPYLHPSLLSTQRKLHGVFSRFIDELSEEASPYRLTQKIQMIAPKDAFESAMQNSDLGL
jgi:hypothetical protein